MANVWMPGGLDPREHHRAERLAREQDACFTVAPGCTYLEGRATPEDVRVTPDGRHGYALETEAGGGYAVGVAQVLRRR